MVKFSVYLNRHVFVMTQGMTRNNCGNCKSPIRLQRLVLFLTDCMQMYVGSPLIDVFIWPEVIKKIIRAQLKYA